MTNDLVKFTLILLALSVFSMSCANAQTISTRDKIKDESALSNNGDLSTDEAVIAELQKIVDARYAKLTKDDEKLDAKRKAASKLEAKDVCIERLKESAKIIVIGFFRTDVGCKFDGAFVNSQFFEETDAALSKTALAALGWEKASRQEREKLAKLWVEKGLFAYSALPSRTFGAVSTDDGGIKVIVSLEYPPGITSRNAPKIFVFNKNGELLSASGN